MRIVSKTDVGLARRSNQDAYATGELPGGVAWAVVCDGMGGVGGGNIASALAVKTISEQISASYREGMSSNSVRTMLESAITAANLAVYDASQQSADLAGMGTTVVACVILNGTAHISHVGDSRAYLFSRESIRQITRDHSLVEELMEAGAITAEQARSHPQKNVITRALGSEARVDCDYFTFTLQNGDILLMCSDGLSNIVSDLEMLQCAREYHEPETLCRSLMSKALNRGARDNVTILAVMR